MSALLSSGRRSASPTPARRTAPPSVPLEFVMALSGGVMPLYLALHMVGNLKIFLGAAALDGCAAWPRTILEPVGRRVRG